ncbi:MAG: glycosyl hydrolase, partial [Bacteroidales bacterium]|nr:glycosyl hydrolase [Bacteroidales bacterium]
EVMHSESSFIVSGDNGFTYRNEATEYLFNSLKALTRSDFSMFGVANGLTINYKYGPRHAFNDKSDCKDITGSHPAFIESDFMWYDGDKNFMRNDTIAMREAYKRGMITGYCWHLRGLHSGSFYAYENNVLTADKNLVKEIISNPNRSTNPALNWYLSKIDQLLIPVFKGLGFPIIFRPFHEMTGNWFWWGTSTCTADEYIALYRLTVNYLKANGVNNVLYAWAPDKSADMSRYPGDGYVDVIGYDGYEIGTASYHSITTFTSNYGKLASYALAHNKIAAITETGYGNYPGAHYDYWYDHVLIPMKKHSKARHAAWIMTWYNADWNNNNTGTSWIPYKGIESKSNGQDAIDNFMKFYDDPRTIFANDIPTLYLNDDNSAFVYPSQISINVGDSLTLIGGTKANWFNEKVSWNSDNPSVATIDSSGKVRAIDPGTATITLICPNGNTATCSVMVRSGNRIVNSASNPFKIYPNPITHKLFHVEAGNGYSGKYKIAIYDLFGHCVYQVLQTEKVATIQCNDIKPGVYNVFIETKNQINVFKIVIL